MPAIEPLCKIIGINSQHLTKNEIQFLEAELFIYIYEGVIELIKSQNMDYFRLLKFNDEMENRVIEQNFIQYLLKDILTTGEYSVSGIAYYTYATEEIILELYSGNNANPSLILSRKIIELHRSIRPNLYKELIKKILIESNDVLISILPNILSLSAFRDLK